MGRKSHSDSSVGESAFRHRPFQGLKGAPARRRVAVKAPAPVAREPDVRDASSLFLDAVADVAPLHARARDRVAGPAPATPARAITRPDAEAVAELCDLVTGEGPFDISDGDEHIEGAMLGLDPRLVRRLRAGEYAYQAHLDLHGMTSAEARAAVDGFLTAAYQNGKRCVLIVHGRGRNSKDQIPVLKSRLANWLARGRWKRIVLAFTSARACDGGAGALYVLLRRRRDDKQPIRVTTGAKW